MLILSGYQGFAEALSQEADVEVYLNQKVRKIVWKEGESEVICGSGASVFTKSVVLAVPIGVLKSKYI